ncbi:MAG TPA: CPBP family glutamic-type intramembrane protease [Aliidiomarina sp.]|nr:CPBP family glutamic-type intramembrane protease [Aliidiomarina sp.]
MEDIKRGVILFVFGFLGIASLAFFIPHLLSFQTAALPISVEVVQVLSTIQSSVLLFLMIWLGLTFSKKVGLTAPVVASWARLESGFEAFKPQIIPALIGGIVGGLFLLAFFGLFTNYLPAEFLTAGENLTLPWYAKILYGGITEEILIRWGLMSFLVWGIYWLTQKNGSEVRPHNYIIAVIVSALVFGLGHLPVVFALTSEVTVSLVIYIVLGNAFFGFIAGYLFWKRGLECAIIAHMVAHFTMILAAGFS